jgi:hypothetical protein
VFYFLSAVSDLLRSHAWAENHAVIRDVFYWHCVQRSHPIWTQAVSNFSKQCKSCVCQSQWLCSLRWRSWPPGCWDHGFKSYFRHGCLFLVSMLCCFTQRPCNNLITYPRSPAVCVRNECVMERRAGSYSNWCKTVK